MFALRCNMYSHQLTRVKQPCVVEMYSYSKQDGYLEYRGNFHVEKEELPIDCEFRVFQLNDLPCKIGNGVCYYDAKLDDRYEVELYKHQRVDHFHHKIWFHVRRQLDIPSPKIHEFRILSATSNF